MSTFMYVFVFSEKGRITGQISVDESIRAHANLVGDFLLSHDELESCPREFIVSVYMTEFRSWFDDPYPIHEIFLERISTRVKRCRFVVGGTKVFGSAGLMDKACRLPLSSSLLNTYFELVPGPHQQQRQLEHTKWLLSPLLLFLPQWLLLAALP